MKEGEGEQEEDGTDATHDFKSFDQLIGTLLLAYVLQDEVEQVLVFKLAEVLLKLCSCDRKESGLDVHLQEGRTTESVMARCRSTKVGERRNGPR